MKSKQPPHKRLLALLLSLCMVCGMLPGMTLTALAEELTSGTGSAENPLSIRTAQDLAQVGQLINSGSIWSVLGVPENSILYYRLEADISLSSYASGTGWTPIGSEARPFTGVFDGNGHTISGLTISLDYRTDASNPLSYPGLFGTVSGTVTDVTMQGVSITGRGNTVVCAGGIAGRLLAGGVIENCFVSGRLENVTTGGDGGIVGFLDGGAVRNCIVTASLIGTGLSGGVCGFDRNHPSSGSVTGCAVLSKQIGGYVIYRSDTGSISTSSCFAWDGVGTIYGAAGFQETPTKTAEELQTAAGWPEKFRAAPWNYEEGKMPSLTAIIQPLPTYITGDFEGKGTAKEPYLIGDLEGLALFAKQSRTDSLAGVCFKLTASLDMKEYAAKAGEDPAFDPAFDPDKGWHPIQDFQGNFDGGGFAIQNLFINRPEEDNVGFFGTIWGNRGSAPVTALSDGAEGILQNLGVENADVTGKANTGALLGWTDGGQLLRCYSTGKVAGGGKYRFSTKAEDQAEDDLYQFRSTGGLAGQAFEVSIVGCYSTAKVDGVLAVGGIVGFFGGTLTDCYTTGDVFSKYGQGVGGVIGMDHYESSVIARCFSTSTVTAGPLFKWNLDSWTGTGGVVGFGVGHLENLIALNFKVDNNLPSEITPSDPHHYSLADKVVGINVQRKNDTQKGWTGTELRGRTDLRTMHDNNSDYYKSAKAWAAFAKSGEWNIEDGKLPTLKNTGGEQSSDPPLWFDDKFVGDYATEPKWNGNAYEIWKASDLAWCSLHPDQLSGKSLEIKDNLDLTPYSLGEGWLPIGMEEKNTIRNLKVYGNDKTITGLTVNRKHGSTYNPFGGFSPSSDANYGLFGRLEDSSIGRLHLRDAYFGGGWAAYIGALVAYGKNLRVEECSAESRVEELGNFVGGLVGLIDDNCTLLSNSTRLTVDYHEIEPLVGQIGMRVGGILGVWQMPTSKTTFHLSNAWSDLKISAAFGVAGGIVGTMHIPQAMQEETMLLSDCYARIDVSYDSPEDFTNEDIGTGGLIGSMQYSQATNKSYRFANCYVTGSLTGSHTGGVIGAIYPARGFGSTDKTTQIRLDNVVVLPEKIAGSNKAGMVCGSNTTRASDGHLVCHFRSVTDGGKDKNFIQKFDRWNGTKYILAGAELTTNQELMQLDDSPFASYFSSVRADDIASTYFLKEPWLKKGGAWSVLGSGALPTLSSLSEANGHLRQSNSMPLYILKACTWARPNSVEVSSRVDLDKLSEYVAAGGETRSLTILLTQSVDMGSTPFTPIGTEEHPFNGNFNGQGYSIRGLTVDTTASGGPAGLFGVAAPYSAIQNLALIDPDIQGANDVGALAGVMSGSVRQCYAAAANVSPWSSSGAHAQVRGDSNVGGLIGRLSGPNDITSVENCYTAVNVLAAKDNAGGLVGFADAVSDNVTKTLSCCFTVGRVTAQGKTAGGVYGGSQAGERLVLQSMAVLSPSVTEQTARRDNAIGGDQTALVANGRENYIWKSLGFTWKEPLQIVTMRDNLGNADGLWKSAAQYSDSVWSLADNATPTLKGFADAQNDYIDADMEEVIEPEVLKTDEEGYYLIRNAGDWETMGRMVNGDPKTYAGAKFRLMEDISFEGALAYVDGYVPVGQTVPFTGELDGNHRTIAFAPTGFADGDIGLFGILGSGARIHDLTVNANIKSTRKSTQNTGVVAAVAQAGSTLQGITVTGSVKDTAGAASNSVYRRVGGLAGLAEGEIVSCQNRAAVSGGYYIGGIAGQGNGKLTFCVNEGAVTSSDGGCQGGIIGYMYANGTASQCANRGGVSGKDAGGIAGRIDRALVERSFSTGPVTGTSGAGGIAGYQAEATVENAYATGSVSGRTAGGITGFMDGAKLRRCYAAGTVQGSRDAGGIAGMTSRQSVLEQTAALNLGIGETGSRLVGAIESGADYSQNNYGLDTLSGKQSGAAYTGQDVTRETLHTREFWETTLGLSAGWWEIPAAKTRVDDFFLPTLKNLGEQENLMPLHLKLYAREGKTTIELTADKTQLWSPKGQAETVVFTAAISGTTETVVKWSCSDPSLTAKGGTDENGNPACTLTIPEGYQENYSGGEICVTATFAANSAISDSVTIQVDPLYNAKAPVITAQPKDTSTVVGKPVTLTVTAESKDNGTLSYQWYRTDIPGKDGTAIDKATGASYEVPAARTESWYYYCVVTNTIQDGQGMGVLTASVKSDAAKVDVTKDAQKALTIVGGNRTMTYGDDDFTLKTSDGSGTGAVAWESSNPDVVSVDANGKVTIHKASAASVTITAIKAEDHQFTASSAAITVTVNKARLTVTADGKTREYGEPNPALTYTITGFVKGENASVLTEQPVAACAAGFDAAVGTHPITVSGGNAENYEFVYVSGALTVTKTGQTALSILQGAQIDKTYGDDAFTLSVTGGSGNGAVRWASSDEAVASVDQAGKVTVHKAGAAVIVATKAADGKYVEAKASATVTVKKAVLTVTAKNAEKHFGEENPKLDYTVTGFVNGEDKNVLSKQPAVSVDTDFSETELPVGSYVIKVEGGEAGNYKFVYQNATLIVNKADQSTFQIEGGNPVKSYGSASFTLTTKNGAGGVVTWQSSDETVALVDEITGEITIVGAGQALITAVSAETGNFAEAVAAVTLTVEKAKLHIQADPQTRIYGDANPEFTYTIEGFVNEDNVEDLDALPVLTADADKTTGVGSYAVRLSSGGDNNYAYVLNNAELTITPRPVTIKADDKKMTQGESMPELTWTVTEGSILEGDRLEGSLKAGGDGVGTHPITQDTPFANPNYLVTFLPGTLTVEEKPEEPISPESKPSSSTEEEPEEPVSSESKPSSSTEEEPEESVSSESNPSSSTEEKPEEPVRPESNPSSSTEEKPEEPVRPESKSSPPTGDGDVLGRLTVLLALGGMLSWLTLRRRKNNQ